MAKSDSPFAIAALAAKVHTVGQARAALGAVADTLQDGYKRLPEITGLADLQEESRRQLDIANAYAQGVYAIYSGATPDLFDEEISFSNAARVGLAMERARQTLREIEDAANTEWWDLAAIIAAALAAVKTAVDWTAKTVANAAAAVAAPLLSTFWPYLAIIALGIVLYFRFWRKAIGGGR